MSGPEHRITELDSGVRIVTEAMPSVRSVALGFWIGTGSRYESEADAGLSHLIEHLLFKGSPRYSSQQIDELFDTMGAELNAGTGKETTSVYARVLDEHLVEAVDVMSDMVWRPSLSDIDSERAVILEEIAMYEDDPQDRVFDLLGRAVFGDDPLGRAIIGRKEVVAGASRDQIAGFHAARYVPGNVVVAGAGSVDHDALVALIAERARDEGGSFASAHPVPTAQARVRFERKETEQYHLCLGGPGLARDDERRFAMRVLDTLLGGSSSSRLFQEVREKRGLAYAVYTFAAHHADTGQIGVYLGTRGDNLQAAVQVVADELQRVRTSPPDAEEVARARDNLKGRIVLGLESTSARMNRLGSSLLTDVPLLTVDEAIAAIDAVTADDVASLAAELWDPARLSVAAIGLDEAVLTEAVAPLRGELPAVSGA